MAQDAIVHVRSACGDVDEERVQLVYRTSHVLQLLPFLAHVLLAGEYEWMQALSDILRRIDTVLRLEDASTGGFSLAQESW